MNRINRKSLLGAKKIHHLRNLIGNNTSPTTVFICGAQRSGTNMFMEVLERNFDTDLYHEWNIKAYNAYSLRSDPVLKELKEKSLAPFVVFKALLEMHRLGELLDTFSPAKALWIVRDFNDTVRSHAKLWRGCKEQIAHILQDQTSAEWRGLGLSQDTLHIINEHYSPDMSIESAIALFWYFRNTLYFDQGFDTDDRVTVIRYEEFVRNPQIGAQLMAAALGFKASEFMTKNVHGKSINRSINEEISPDIRALCESMLEQLDKNTKTHPVKLNAHE